MDRTFDDGSSGSGLVKFFIILIVLAILTALFAPMLLTLSLHASTGHLNRTWNAININDYMESGACIPQEYLCPNGILIRYCDRPDKLGESIGLVINTIRDVIVTGYSAKTKYWSDQNRMCK